MTLMRYKILVPVDNTSNSNKAIARAVKISETVGAEIHFIYVTKKPFITWVPGAETGFPIQPVPQLHQQHQYLQKLTSYVNAKIPGSNKLHQFGILTGSRKKVLLQYILENDIDLVVYGLPQLNFIKKFNANKDIRFLGKESQVPVLRVSNESLNKMKKIVIPLATEIPLKTLKMGAALGKAFGSTIYLVGVQPVSGIINSTMETTVDFIKSISNVKVQSYFLEGKNLVKSTLKFSRNIQADLIMINPFKEFSLPGFFNRITKRIIPDDKENYLIFNN